MRIALINGSPKVNNSASGTLLSDIKGYLGERAELVESILKGEARENNYVSVAFPRFLYKMGAQMGWRQMIKANGGKTKDLKRKQ